MYTIQVVASGGGATYNICRVDTLEEGAGVVKSLEAFFKAWERSGYNPAWPACIRYFEGCDVYAEGPDGLYTYVDTWEKV